MKRTYLARRNALFSSAQFSWGAGALAFAIFTLLLRLLAPDFFWYAFTPVFRASDAIAIQSHSFFSSFADAAKLSARNETLVRENAELFNENEALRKNLSVLSALDSSEGILAAVVARPPESPYDSLVIAGGEEAGISVGMEAFADGGVPIGIVSSVTGHFSRITLFSSPSLTTHGWVGDAGTPLVISGSGGGTFSAMLAADASVAVGDTVFVPGPGMLPLGTVIRIDTDPSRPGVMLRIASRANLFSLSWILVRDTGKAFSQSLFQATSTPR